MPSNYRNDQFFNISNLTGGMETADAPMVTSAPDNPRFKMWDTNSTVRVTDENGNPRNLQMQRGYIRSLITSAYGTNIPIRKCQFQFNPQVIQQTVSSSDGMLNVLQQPIEQLAQPISASQTFGFQLFFDRSMEVNNAPNVAVNYTDPWDQGDPGQVGVLRDLSVLYSIIGQGFSATQQSFVQQALLDQARTTAANAAAAAAATGSASSSTATQQTADSAANISNFVTQNVGNSAFLLPLPVRIVFSSLFMVEGLVTNTDVSFTKFSTTMVPMQCVVNITMDAKYIGFAKKDTVFTAAIAARAQAVAQDIQNQKDVQSQGLTALRSVFSAIDFRLINMDNNIVSYNDLLTNKGYQVRCWQHVPAASSNDAIISLWNSSQISTLTSSPVVEVWGPYYGLLPNLTMGQLKQRLAASRTNSAHTEWPLFSGKFTFGQETADAYKQYVTSIPNTGGIVIAETGTLSSDIRSSANGSSSGPHTYSTSGLSYIVSVTGAVTMIMADGTVISSKFDSYFQAQPTDLSSAMQWRIQPVVPTSSASSPSAPANNTATKTPTPGSVSKVGDAVGTGRGPR